MLDNVECIHSTSKGREVDFFSLCQSITASKRVGQGSRNDFFRRAYRPCKVIQK